MDPFEQLLTSSSSSTVGAETLEMLGRKAASMFLEKGVPLNDAIRQLTSENGDLNSEHIKRIVEFANNVTFQEMHSKNEDKNVQFAVADAGAVLRDLKDGGSPAHDGKPLDMSDYSRAPMEKKDFADLDSGLSHLMNMENQNGTMGQGEPLQKVASAAGTDTPNDEHVNPILNIYDSHLRLQRTHEELVGHYEQQHLLYKQASEAFYQAARREVMAPEGVGLSGVLSAVHQVAPVEKVATDFLGECVKRMVKEGAITSDALKQSLTKIASAQIVNVQHPIIATYVGMLKISHNLQQFKIALAQVDEGLAESNKALRAALTGVKAS